MLYFKKRCNFDEILNVIPTTNFLDNWKWYYCYTRQSLEI